MAWLQRGCSGGGCVLGSIRLDGLASEGFKHFGGGGIWRGARLRRAGCSGDPQLEDGLRSQKKEHTNTIGMEARGACHYLQTHTGGSLLQLEHRD